MDRDLLLDKRLEHQKLLQMLDKQTSLLPAIRDLKEQAGGLQVMNSSLNGLAMPLLAHHSSSLVQQLTNASLISPSTSFSSLPYNLVNFKRIDLPLVQPVPPTTEKDPLTFTQALMKDIQCMALIGSKELLLGIENSISLYSLSERSLMPGQMIALKSRASDIAVYLPPGAGNDGSSVNNATSGASTTLTNAIIVVAEGYLGNSPTLGGSPDDFCIKIFKGFNLIKEIPEPKFRPGYFFSAARFQINAFGKIFCQYKEKLFFISSDKYIYAVDLSKAEFPVSKLYSEKTHAQQIKANSTGVFGITPQSALRITYDGSIMAKKFEAEGVLTAIDATEKHVFVCQHQGLEKNHEHNYLIVLDLHLKRSNEIEVRVKESMRHVKAFTVDSKEYIICSTFGYDSTVLLYHFHSPTHGLGFVKGIEGANQSNFCSWINSFLIVPSTGNLITCGPLSHLTLNKATYDL